MSRDEYRVQWAEVARQDLDEIVDYVAKERPMAAVELLTVPVTAKAGSAIRWIPAPGR